MDIRFKEVAGVWWFYLDSEPIMKGQVLSTLMGKVSKYMRSQNL